MGIFASARNAISASFDLVTDMANTAGETVSMGTTYVHNRAVKHKLTDKQQVMLDTAKDMRDIQAELEADDALKEMFDSLKDEFE